MNWILLIVGGLLLSYAVFWAAILIKAYFDVTAELDRERNDLRTYSPPYTELTTELDDSNLNSEGA